MSGFNATPFHLQQVDTSSLGRGLERGLTHLASGIQQRQRQEELRRQQEEASKLMRDVLENSRNRDGSFDFQKASEAIMSSPLDTAQKQDLMQMGTQLYQQQQLRSRVEQQQIENAIKMAKAQREADDYQSKKDTDEAAAWYSQNPDVTPIDFYRMAPSSVAKGYVEGSRESLDRKNIESQIADREKNEKESAREQKIKDYQETFGWSRSMAMDMVDGNIRIVTDPVMGGSVAYNTRTDESRPVDMPSDLKKKAISEATAPGEGAGEASINLYRQAENTTGLWPTLSNTLQGVTGQFGINVADPEVQEAIQNFTTVKRDLVRALANNPRFLGTEMEVIRKEIDISPGVFTDVQTLQSKMRGIDSALRERLKNMREAKFDRSLPADTRQAAAQNEKDIANFLRVLGVPREDESQGTLSGPPDGVDPEIWEIMEPEERALWQ